MLVSIHVGFFCEEAKTIAPCHPGFYCPEASPYAIPCPRGHYCEQETYNNGTIIGMYIIIVSARLQLIGI